MRRTVKATATVAVGVALLIAPAAAQAATTGTPEGRSVAAVKPMINGYDDMVGTYWDNGECNAKGMEGIQKRWWADYYCYFNADESELWVRWH